MSQETNYHVIENFIDPEYCKALLDYVIENKQEEEREFYATIPLGGEYEFSDPLAPKIEFDPEDKILEAANFAKDFFLENYSISGDLKVNRSHVNVMLTGASLNPHKDRSNAQTHVCGLYLNDDYEGGELILPDSKIDIKPKAGSLVLFQGDKELHGVNEITSGMRVNILIYFIDTVDAE